MILSTFCKTIFFFSFSFLRDANRPLGGYMKRTHKHPYKHQPSLGFASEWQEGNKLGAIKSGTGISGAVDHF